MKQDAPRAEPFFHALSLLAVLLTSSALVYYGLSLNPYFLPTFDNSMLHAGRARVILDSGNWAERELVFGGETKSYHSPFYPAIAAGLSSLTGLNLWWAIRLLSLLVTGLLLPLGFYALAKRVAGSWPAGVAAALAALGLPNLMTWGSRTSPISLGVFLVVLALYFVARGDYRLALLAGLALAFTHQPSLLSFGLALAFYFAAATALKAFENRNKGKLDFRGAFESVKPLFVVGALTLAAYLAWHFRQTGLSCLDFKCLPHAASHEYGSAVDLLAFLQRPERLLAVAGIAAAALSKRVTRAHKLLLFSWLVATLVLVKNDVLGIAVFTERFLTFFDEALAVFAGVFVGWAYAKAEEIAGKKNS